MHDFWTIPTSTHVMYNRSQNDTSLMVDKQAWKIKHLKLCLLRCYHLMF